jgi:speckle-type POZ protein
VGTERTLKRVAAQSTYSCLMLRTQLYSSLFRHYAKQHDLYAGDLEYYFTDVLKANDSAETIQLMRGDTIMVCPGKKNDPALY